MSTGRQLHNVGNSIIDYFTDILSHYSTLYTTSVLPQSSLALSVSLVRCKIGAFMSIIDNRDVLVILRSILRFSPLCGYMGGLV
jgi:hypothetical protein